MLHSISRSTRLSSGSLIAPKAVVCSVYLDNDTVVPCIYGSEKTVNCCLQQQKLRRQSASRYRIKSGDLFGQLRRSWCTFSAIHDTSELNSSTESVRLAMPTSPPALPRTHASIENLAGKLTTGLARSGLQVDSSHTSFVLSALSLLSQHSGLYFPSSLFVLPLLCLFLCFSTCSLCLPLFFAFVRPLCLF